MAYGIGSVIGDIDQKVDTYRNKPEALAQMYQQNQQLIDLLALQKLKTEKEAAMRDMQMKMQTPAASIKDQREQEVMGMMRNEVAQQVAPGLQVAGQQAAQAAAPPAPQGGGLQSLPAPNMQGMGMAEGGIVAFAGERGSYVSQEAYRRQKAKERAEKERRELEAVYGNPALPYSPESILQDLMNRNNRPTSTGREDVAPVDPGPGSVEPRVSREALRKFDEQRAAGDQDRSGIGDAIKDQWNKSQTRELLTDPGAQWGRSKTKEVVDGLGGLLNRAGSSIADAWREGRREGSRIQARPYPGQEYVQLMENPDRALSAEDKQLEAAKRMGLIPDERAQAASQAASQPASQPASQAGISTVVPQTAPTQNQTPPAGVELSEEGIKAVLNIPSEAVKQAPPEVQNEYTRRLSELRGEQESKLEALIAFLQGAGGKTSFAATMSGGAAGMNAHEQQIENEIMATVDKIEGLKLKEREIGVQERQVSTTEEANRIRESLGNAQIESGEREGAAERALRAEIARDGRISDETIAEMRSKADVAIQAAENKNTLSREENANLREVYRYYSAAAQGLLEVANDYTAGGEAQLSALKQFEAFKTTLSSLETQLKKTTAGGGAASDGEWGIER